jgi:hypothetical protein
MDPFLSCAAALQRTVAESFAQQPVRDVPMGLPRKLGSAFVPSPESCFARLFESSRCKAGHLWDAATHKASGPPQQWCMLKLDNCGPGPRRDGIALTSLALTSASRDGALVLRLVRSSRAGCGGDVGFSIDADVTGGFTYRQLAPKELGSFQPTSTSTPSRADVATAGRASGSLSSSTKNKSVKPTSLGAVKTAPSP